MKAAVLGLMLFSASQYQAITKTNTYKKTKQKDEKQYTKFQR